MSVNSFVFFPSQLNEGSIKLGGEDLQFHACSDSLDICDFNQVLQNTCVHDCTLTNEMFVRHLFIATLTYNNAAL
jgi:hypothetical protein